MPLLRLYTKSLVDAAVDLYSVLSTRVPWSTTRRVVVIGHTGCSVTNPPVSYRKCTGKLRGFHLFVAVSNRRFGRC